jgi:hypothetical protein
MKAQLVKRQDRFDLYNESDGSKIASTSPNPMGKLSLKNCQAIKNGYDLDELINRAFDNMGYHSTVTPHEENQFKLGYRIAFREALEILGDKKFSEEDVRKAINWSWRKTDREEHILITDEKDFIQSLQQTEFDVEIVMECCGKVYSQHCDGTCEHVKPLLDVDGCLILKRK